MVGNSEGDTVVVGHIEETAVATDGISEQHGNNNATDGISDQHVNNNVESVTSDCVVESHPSISNDFVEDEEFTPFQSASDVIIPDTPAPCLSQIAVGSESLSNTVFGLSKIVELISTFAGERDRMRKVVLSDRSHRIVTDMTDATVGADEAEMSDVSELVDDEIEVPEERCKAQAVMCDRELARTAGRSDTFEDTDIGDLPNDEEFEVPTEQRPQKQTKSASVSKQLGSAMFSVRSASRRDMSPEVVERTGEICVLRKDSQQDGSSPKRGKAVRRKSKGDLRASSMPEVIMKHCLMKGLDSPIYRIESADIENAARDLDRLKKQFAERKRPSYDEATPPRTAGLDDFADLGTECPLAPLECSLSSSLGCGPNKCRSMR